VNTSARVLKILRQAKRLAREYYNLTRRPLGVTGEVAEYEAVRLLRLKLAPVRQPGFDATRKTSRGVRRFQIKGRRILADSKPGQRMGSIRLKHEWDAVLLVVLNSTFDAVAIYQAERAPIRRALIAPGSKARNERGALSVDKFIAIGKQVWPPAHRRSR